MYFQRNSSTTVCEEFSLNLNLMSPTSLMKTDLFSGIYPEFCPECATVRYLLGKIFKSENGTYSAHSDQQPAYQPPASSPRPISWSHRQTLNRLIRNLRLDNSKVDEDEITGQEDSNDDPLIQIVHPNNFLPPPLELKKQHAPYTNLALKEFEKVPRQPNKSLTVATRTL